EISEVKLKELLQRASELMDMEEDSLIVFKSREQKWLDKQILGKEKGETDNFL
ncbi:MAG: CRISPR-associated endonuclease Cas2, partial [Bacteroidia bacterium]|nr:CRISPR-associated endonuclease Cas2 [Bacteroidia bacterium]